MEKRSRRRIRDLVTQAASQGLSQNEIGRAAIRRSASSGKHLDFAVDDCWRVGTGGAETRQGAEVMSPRAVTTTH
jgi:hypothetical protein